VSGLQLALRVVPPGMFDRLVHLQHQSRVARPLIQWGARRIRRRTGVVAHGIGAGLRFDCGQSLLSYLAGTSEPEVQRALARLVAPGQTAWDIGANVGFFSLLLARLVGRAGRVLAVEPHPANAATLRRNVALNSLQNVDVLEAAVADADGVTTLSIDRGSTVAKLVSGASVAHSTVDVRVVTLDELWAAEKYGAPALIKMDIEGAETRALQGARRLLESAQPVVLCELHATNRPVVEILDSAGYACFSLEDPRQDVAAGFWNTHVVGCPRTREQEIRQLLLGS
jgi:FkbM family methyltransferase